MVTTTGTDYTDKLARFIDSFQDVSISNETVHHVKNVILDYYCSAITGSTTEVSQKLFKYLSKKDSPNTCNAIGYNRGLSKENAAYINGTSAHCYDFDDGHSKGSFHPGAVVIPAVISTAKVLDATSEEIIRAVLIGYEISIRVSSAMHPASRKRGFHNTPVAGIFGATAALTYLNKMKLEDIKQAFGIAGSFASGLFAFLGSGSEIKRLHPGKAAHDAMMAVDLVKQGITGPTNVLENKNGVFRAFAGGDISVDNLLNGLGEELNINKVYFKPYPCCRHLHSSIDAVYNIKKYHSTNLTNIKEVHVGVNSMAYLHNHKYCQSLLDAQMSLPYAVASSLFYNHLSMSSFEPSQAPKELWELLDKIDVHIDEQAERVYPKERLANVKIVVNDGAVYQNIVPIPLGEPENPMSEEQLVGKFMENCSPVIGEEKAKQFVSDLKSWSVDARDSKFLFEV